MIITESFEPHFEWKFYDTAELHFYALGHGEVEIFDNDSLNGSGLHPAYCTRCHQDINDPEWAKNAPFQGRICDVDVTDEYRNFIRNMVAVVSIAAAGIQPRVWVVRATDAWEFDLDCGWCSTEQECQTICDKGNAILINANLHSDQIAEAEKENEWSAFQERRRVVAKELQAAGLKVGYVPSNGLKFDCMKLDRIGETSK